MIFRICDDRNVLAKIEAKSFSDAAIKFAAGRRYSFEDMGQLDLSERCREGVVHISVDGVERRIISDGYISEADLHTHAV